MSTTCSKVHIDKYRTSKVYFTSSKIYFTLREAHVSTSSTVLVCPFIHMFACTMCVCSVCTEGEQGEEGGWRERKKVSVREWEWERERECECEQASASLCERDSHADIHIRQRQSRTTSILLQHYLTACCYYRGSLLLSHFTTEHLHLWSAWGSLPSPLPSDSTCPHSLPVHTQGECVCVCASERARARERVSERER